MLLIKLLQKKNEIEKLRMDMYHTAEKRGLKDKQTLRISQDLDKEIVVLQRMLLTK